jgi:Ice-binding-like
MTVRFAALAVLILSASNLLLGSALSVSLGSADSYGVLAGTTVTNTGATTIDGNLGVWSGTAITGFPPGILSPGSVANAGNAAAQQAQADLTTAYNFAAGETSSQSLNGDLGGLTLTPGVYTFGSTAALTGTLTLNALGDPNAVFVFQIGSSLTTANGSVVNIINGGTGDNVFWQVGSSATLGTNTTFTGNVLALTSITVNTGTTITCGRVLAINGAVTLDTNTVSINTVGCEAGSVAPTGVPEPGGLLLSGFGLLGLSLAGRRWLR